jgi:hypothetical protein
MLKVNRRFGRTSRFHLQGRRICKARNQQATCFTLVSYLAYSSILKMEATCSSETSVDFQQTTGRYNPEDRNHNHRSENLKSCKALNCCNLNTVSFLLSCWRASKLNIGQLGLLPSPRLYARPSARM